MGLGINTHISSVLYLTESSVGRDVQAKFSLKTNRCKKGEQGLWSYPLTVPGQQMEQAHRPPGQCLPCYDDIYYIFIWSIGIISEFAFRHLMGTWTFCANKKQTNGDAFSLFWQKHSSWNELFNFLNGLWVFAILHSYLKPAGTCLKCCCMTWKYHQKKVQSLCGRCHNRHLQILIKITGSSLLFSL